MVRHWNRHLRSERDKRARSRMRRARLINGFGFIFTATVLVIVIITKFTHGAWIAAVAMLLLFVMMKGIQRHYQKVGTELTVKQDDRERMLPSRVHSIVLVSKVHKPTLRALLFARATRPDTLTALTVNVDEKDTRALQEQWDKFDIPLPLTVVESPYREVTKPVLEYVRRIRRESPRDLIMVFIPEYVVGHWWEQLLHNQSALRLKARLLYLPNVMVTNVPWQLESSAATDIDEPVWSRPGQLRLPEARRPTQSEASSSPP
ncbi:MAG: DNA-binding protein, partial [Antricoccus sp.]